MWRIIVGVSLVPAFGTLYQRLTLPESTRYQKSQGMETDDSDIENLKKKNEADVTVRICPFLYHNTLYCEPSLHRFTVFDTFSAAFPGSVSTTSMGARGLTAVFA